MAARPTKVAAVNGMQAWPHKRVPRRYGIAIAGVVPPHSWGRTASAIPAESPYLEACEPPNRSCVVCECERFLALLVFIIHEYLDVLLGTHRFFRAI